MEKDAKQKRSKKTAILLSLMFLVLISPKAWGYAQGELPPPFSDKPFSSDDTFFPNDTFAFSRAVLTNEKGLAICQVNLVENPEFLPGFAKPSSSNTPQPLDLPECEEQSLDIVAQYAEQAWVKKEVAIFPVITSAALTLTSGCAIGFITWITTDIAIRTRNKNSTSVINREDKNKSSRALSAFIGGTFGVFTGISIPNGPKLVGNIIGIGVGTISALVCYDITDRIFYE